MAFNKIVQYDTTPNFLESEEGLILKTFTAEQANAVTIGNRKIIQAGTVFPKNETGAKGIVYQDVDMTDDEKRPISVIVAGRVFEDRLPVAPETDVKTELQELDKPFGIAFLTEPEFEF